MTDYHGTTTRTEPVAASDEVLAAQQKYELASPERPWMNIRAVVISLEGRSQIRG